ncbi:MAG: M23 family metallopeptidase [Dokdonella sp.]
MIVRTLLSSLVLIASAQVAAKDKPGKKAAATPPGKSVTLKQGEVGRWPGIAAKQCAIDGKSYPAVDAVCYYPIDIEAKPGRHQITVRDQDGKQHKGVAIVEAVDWPEVKIELPNDTYVNISPDNERRAAKERTTVLALFKGKPGEPRFSLPLGAPASPLTRNEDDFGSQRTFNEKVASHHTGRDYPVPVGAPVKAVAEGKVVLAEEQFLLGKCVFVDHGDGLISMNFHFSEISVKVGDEVKRGQELGKVGATGRASGPHLHLGIRWMGSRIDPQPLLDSPLQLHEVGDKPIEEEKKEERTAEPKESTQSIRRDEEG